MSSINRFILFFIAVAFSSCQCKDIDCGFDIEAKPPQTTAYSLEVPENFPPFPREYKLTIEEIALGRKLFYDPILSADGTQACASCHNQSYGFTDSGERFSDGIDGITGDFNSMSIINLAWDESFFWNGRRGTLNGQALEPVINPIEMHNSWKNAIEALRNHPEYPKLFYDIYGFQEIDSTMVTNVIAQFELTLISSNSRYDKFVRKEIPFSPAELNGLLIFSSDPRINSWDPPGADCYHCHKIDNLLLTTAGGYQTKFKNNGLDAMPDSGLMAVTKDPSDFGKFKTPTLRNITSTAPYMHDGRFATLEEVLDHYIAGVDSTSPNIDPIMLKPGGIGGGLLLSQSEKNDLLTFLNTLKDSDFLTNANFSDPN